MDLSSHVAELMTKTVFKVQPDESLLDAARQMREVHVSGFPVVDAAQRLVGVVSEVDLVRDLDEGTGILRPRGLLDLLLESRDREGRSPLELAQQRLVRGHVRDVMTRRAVSIAPNASIADAARTMRLHGINRLPVVDADRRVVGIVTSADILAAVSGTVLPAVKRRRRPSFDPKAAATARAATAGEDPYADI